MYCTILSQKNCQPCQKAREFLYEQGEAYVVVININESKFYKTIMKMAGLTTTPQVFSPFGEHIGGYDDLLKWFS